MTDGGEPNCHTITGDGTIPEDATVQTRDSPVEVTLQTDIDESPHHCGGCDRDFRTIDRLLNHACAENFGAPSPDESGDDRIPMTDGGQPGGAMASSAMDGADGEEKRLEDLEPTISPEQIRAEMSETRRIILQTLVDLDAERDTVRYRTILSRIEDEHDLRLAAETLLEHFTFIVLYDLAERSYTARLNTIVEPTEAALDVLDDNGGESR